ncbi:MAG: hypothetical protein ACM3UV_01245 [Nocardioidaceae bacterium]
MANPTNVDDERKRMIAAGVLGGEAGAALGLLLLGGLPLAPLAATATGAALGPLCLLGVRRGRQLLVRRWIREQLKHAR